MTKVATKIDFTNLIVYVGIDTHKKTWFITILFEGTTKRMRFDPNPKKLADYLKKHYPGATYKTCYEAGYSGFWIHERLNQEGIETIVVHAADVPTTDKESKHKTDPIDSRKLAECLRAGLLKGIYVPSIENQEDRALVRQRHSLVKDQTRVKNRIKSKLHFFGIEIPKAFVDTKGYWPNRYINFLETVEFTTDSAKEVMDSLIRHLRFIRSEILRILRKIRKLTRTETYDKKMKLLQSVPGVGPIIAVTTLTEIEDINRFKDINQFASYLGLIPTEHSSGEKQRTGHLTKRCNKLLKPLLVEAAWVAIANDPALAVYYNTSKQKIGWEKSIIKVAKKLSSRIMHVLKYEDPYIKGVV